MNLHQIVGCFFQNSNSIGLGINLGTVIGGPSSGSSGGTGSPLSGITSGETSPPGTSKTIIEGNGGNGATTLLGMSDLGIGFNNSASQAPGAPAGGTKSVSPENPIFFCPRRPNIGREGRPIILRANHVQINMPRYVQKTS